jgi:D-alanyl-lipoteichoic acid acyltransferase DltB (MBOAT superfamily)
MLFNSITFAIFLPVVFLLYWFVFNRNLRLQNFFIVVVSYIFYGWWDWRFLFLIAFTTFCSWGSGILMQRIVKKDFDANRHPFSRYLTAKSVLIGNIVLNIGILCLFKYYNFFVDNFIAMFAAASIHLQPATLNIILPVGISFYTFQALSYSIDVYKKRIQPTMDIVAFFAYVGFFPQLVAGPIERATNFLPQFYVKRTFDYVKAVDGMRQILWGLFKKIVIADNCAMIANDVFGNYEFYPGISLVWGAFFFTFQIYGDFSGYSDIAIGTARLFGFNLMRNFAYPYFSRDIAEFWRRWHISLTTWFRDYVYIPLGGSRVSKSKVIRNTFVIFLVSGFWHGANWTFIAWGAFHALLFLPLILSGKNRKNTDTVAEGKRLPNIKELFQMVMTFGLVVFGWILFRAENIAQAGEYIAGIFSESLFSPPIFEAGITAKHVYNTLFFIAAFMFVEWTGRHKQHAFELANIKSPVFKWIIYFGLIYIIWAFGGQQETFIYFQF